MLDAASTSPDYRKLLTLVAEGAKPDVEQARALQQSAQTPFEFAASAVTALAATPPIDARHVELMFDSAWRVIDVDAVRARIQTPAMTARLANRGAN